MCGVAPLSFLAKLAVFLWGHFCQWFLGHQSTRSLETWWACCKLLVPQGPPYPHAGPQVKQCHEITLPPLGSRLHYSTLYNLCMVGWSHTSFSSRGASSNEHPASHVSLKTGNIGCYHMTQSHDLYPELWETNFYTNSYSILPARVSVTHLHEFLQTATIELVGSPLAVLPTQC